MPPNWRFRIARPVIHTTTPALISPAVRRLADQLAPGSRAIYLSVQPAVDAVAQECFPNVEAKIAREGGRMLCGWQVWEWPHVLVEAEFHAVWVSPDGHLVEITPNPHGEARILFIPDPHRVYQGRLIDNVRIPLRDDQMIRDFIRASHRITEVLNRGERTDQHGHVSVPAREIEPVLQNRQFLGEALRAKRRDHDPCPCGNGGKYRRCHGRLFQPMLDA